MKCAEPYPQGSYEECQLDLGHRGDHAYFDTKWARPEPAEPNPAVEAILDRAIRETRTWGEDERRYPVVIERTQVYVVWVDADCEDNALKDAADEPWEIDTSKEMAIDGSDHVRRLDDFERTEAWRSETGYEYGPRIQCPGCGRFSFRREWFHDPMRKCHGPIVWRETQAPNPRYRWSREHRAHPGAEVAA
jgi:hypothetical protein